MPNAKKGYDFTTAINDLTLHIWSYRDPLDTEKQFETYAHMHFHSEFHYIYKGTERITLVDTGDTIEINEGAFCSIPSGVYHTVSMDKNLLRECFFLDIEYNGAYAKHSDYYLFSHILTHRKKITVCKDEFISASMNNFRKISELNQSHNGLHMELMLTNAIVKSIQPEYINMPKSTIERSHSKNNILRYNRRHIIEDFITTSYKTPGGITELANRLYLSERQTHNVVKKLFGEDFKSLIVRQRIQTANALIKTTDLTLEEIAAEVGYNSYSGFYMAYLKLIGVSPETYRQIK